MSFVHAQPKQPRLHGVDVTDVDAAFPAFVEVLVAVGICDVGKVPDNFGDTDVGDDEDKGVGAGEKADGLEGIIEEIEGILKVLDPASEYFEIVAEEFESDVEWLRWGRSTS